MRCKVKFALLYVLTFVFAAICSNLAIAQAADPLPSWNEGPAKQAIIEFVQATTTPGSPDFVPVAKRIATFDNDGTLWPSHPIYTQLAFALDRIKALAPQHPEWKGGSTLHLREDHLDV